MTGGIQDKPVIGIVGGIGSGKSLVAQLIAEYGPGPVKVIDADRIGHDALRQPAIREAVLQRWPEVGEPNGEVSRRRLGQIVFSTTEDGLSQRHELESIVFPWIGEKIQQELDAAQADPSIRLIVLDAAIMLETGWNKVCDRIVYVHAPRSQRLARLAESRGWEPAELARRESAQMSLPAKEGLAHHTLDNSGNPEFLREQVVALLNEIVSYPTL